MQINRLLEMVYMIVEKKNVTAKELAEYFEVSQRTIYRDIDALSGAGIPVYANRGKGGGIRLLDNYVIKKSLLSEREQSEILASLQGMKALNVPDVEPVLNKLAILFNKNEANWIDVDFTQWGSGVEEKEKFNLLKLAILHKNTLKFHYYNAEGEFSERLVEPMQLVFKGQSWYVYGFCRVKNDYRMFRLSRMKKLTLTDDTFTRKIPEKQDTAAKAKTEPFVPLVMKVEAKLAHRVWDEFQRDAIEQQPDGSFTVTLSLPENEWLYGYILSFGDSGEVLAPPHMRQLIQQKLKKSLERYL